MTDEGSASEQQASAGTQTAASTGAQTTSGAEQARSADGRFEPNQWRYPDAYHVEWMRGKTADEVANISNQLYQNMLSGQPTAPQPNMPNPSYPTQPQYAPAQPAGPQPPTPDDWINNPSDAAQRDWAYREATQFRPQINQFAEGMGQQARTIVEMRDPDTFRKYGPQIDLYIKQLDPQFRTVENIQKVVGMVKAEHLDEIVNERTREAISRAQDAGTMRSGGGTGTGASPSASLDFKEAGLPERYRSLLERHRATPEKMREFFSAPSMRETFTGDANASVEKCIDAWLEMAKQGDIITEERLRIGE